MLTDTVAGEGLGDHGGVVFHPITHALIGWDVAQLGRVDRTTRLWCVLASLAPDLDGLSLLFGRRLGPSGSIRP